MILSDGNFDHYLPVIIELQCDYEEMYGEGVDYRTPLAVTYWSFRLMIGFGAFSAALAAAGLWLTRKGRVSGAQWLSAIALIALPMPFLANFAGWIFTEMGRQPWVVAPNPNGVALVRMLTADGVSPVSSGHVITSLTVFTLLYGALAVVWYKLMKRYVKAGPLESDTHVVDVNADSDDDAPMSFAY